MLYVWIGLLVVFLAVEAATVGLVSVWFAGGALIAMLICIFGGSELAQVIVFLVSSVAFLLLFFPMVQKTRNRKKTATNADRILQMKAVVSETIDPIAGTGSVKVDGKVWSARAESGETIEAGQLVTVVRIEGVRAIVVPE